MNGRQIAIRALLACHGSICRSPIAKFVMKQLAGETVLGFHKETRGLIRRHRRAFARIDASIIKLPRPIFANLAIKRNAFRCEKRFPPRANKRVLCSNYLKKLVEHPLGDASVVVGYDASSLTSEPYLCCARIRSSLGHMNMNGLTGLV